MTTKKKKIEFTDESIQELMQETYHEIIDERNRALAAYKKFSKDLDSNSDIAMIGKITNDLLKIVDGSIEKKLRLIKIQADVLYKTSGKTGEGSDTPGTGGSGILTEEDRKMVQEMLAKESITNSEDKNTKNYE